MKIELYSAIELSAKSVILPKCSPKMYIVVGSSREFGVMVSLFPLIIGLFIGIIVPILL